MAIEIQTYERKPPQIQAAQFTGGSPNGPDIVDWVNSHEGMAVWLDAVPATDTMPAREEAIRVSTPEGALLISIGSFIYQDSSKNFYSADSDTFNLEFVLTQI